MDELLFAIWKNRLERLLEEILQLEEDTEKAALSTAIINLQDNLNRAEGEAEVFPKIIDTLASQYNAIRKLVQYNDELTDNIADAELGDDGEFVAGLDDEQDASDEVVDEADLGFDDFGELEDQEESTDIF
jgi:hypothetical protein